MADELHEKPYDFLFGNHIDTHLETKLKLKKGEPGSLKGFLYIIETEDTTDEGLTIYRHPRGAMEGEECGVDVDCEVGWKIKAKPGYATFLSHSGVNGNDHPIWILNRDQIPQPGSNTHFHWIRLTSTNPRAGGVPDECDVDTAGQLEVNADESEFDIVCPGWFLELKAVDKFAFRHGNEVVFVRKGIDNATHLNLVTNYRACA